ncbi:MAG: 2OG-Fe(II) oxygenase [Nitrospirae bacterium]|nr:2OG-Fe(II) oxygenase [Nitrospirota bacterium]MDE3218325.1 2OG-Fe(II) oxygenase [Nitrospirota bacterium]
MQIEFEHFDAERFSFHEHSVLVIEKFFTDEERHYFQHAMQRAAWTPLREKRQLRETFPNCGNWLKADIARAEATVFLDRLALPCIRTYVESFPNIARRHMNFNYYSYGAGDCLLTHDDTAQAGDSAVPAEGSSPLRRLAVVTYFHDEWQPDWGGELIIYRSLPGQHNQSDLTITHCIAPKPGSLVLFTVPRFHRVCRVDPVSGDHKRLSVAGWFMTEHEVPSRRPLLYSKTSSVLMSQNSGT